MSVRFILSRAAQAGALLIAFSSAALADEVTTTTTTSKSSEPGVVVGVPDVVGVEVGKGKPDCLHKQVTKTDDEGDTNSKSVTKCD